MDLCCVYLNFSHCWIFNIWSVTLKLHISHFSLVCFVFLHINHDVVAHNLSELALASTYPCNGCAFSLRPPCICHF